MADIREPRGDWAAPSRGFAFRESRRDQEKRRDKELESLPMTAKSISEAVFEGFEGCKIALDAAIRSWPDGLYRIDEPGSERKALVAVRDGRRVYVDRNTDPGVCTRDGEPLDGTTLHGHTRADFWAAPRVRGSDE